MEQYLQRCLDSLLIKDLDIFNLLEVLVINDGSKDSSLSLAHGYENLYPNVFRVIDKENGNYGSCINRGIDEAKGEYFKILDADDWFDTDSLSALLSSLSLSKENIDVFYSNFTYHNFYTDSVTEHRFKTVKYNQLYDLKDIPFANSADEFMLKMYSVTIKTSILKDIGLRLDTGISYTDNEYMYFPYNHIGRVVFLDINVYQYFIGREGQTVAPKKGGKHLQDVLIITRRELDNYLNMQHTFKADNVKDVLRNMVVGRCLAYYEQALSQEKSDEYEKNLKELYNKIKTDKELLSVVRAKSISFRIWEYTGLYKSSLVLKPFFSLMHIIKK